MEALKNTSAFSPTTGFQKSSKAALAPTSFSEKVQYYTLPENSTEDTRLVFSRYLAYCGTSDTGTLVAWKTWVVTWVCVVTPTFSSRLPSTNYRKIEVGAQQSTKLISLISQLQQALDSEDRAAVDSASIALRGFGDLPLLPRVNPEVDLGLGNGEWIGKVALCYYSLIVFLAGKRIEGSDHSQITSLRPRALRQKAHIAEDLDFLEGELRMSDHSHFMVNNAWAEMGQLRAVVFTEYSSYDSDETDVAKDIIWTSVHLMRYSSMNHALITYNFLQAYPWAVEMPALKTSISIYMASLREAGKIDPRLFPFLKLIYGDKAGLFPRKEMEPLIACALDDQEGTTATLADFYRSATFNPIVEAFRAEKERRENIRGLGLKKKETELMDFFGEEGVPGDAIHTPATNTDGAQL